MIFVTVGTHEQPFDRLLCYLDKIIDEIQLKEKVVCQSGYSKYVPKNYEITPFFAYNEINQLIKDARIIITHGGPSSFIPVLAQGKTPIVVPRERKYNEHVNNHQVDFCNSIEKAGSSIILARDYNDLKDAITNYKKRTRDDRKKFSSNNALFCKRLIQMMEKL